MKGLFDAKYNNQVRVEIAEGYDSYQLPSTKYRTNTISSCFLILWTCSSLSSLSLSLSLSFSLSLPRLLQPYDAVARRDEAKSQHGKVYKAAKHPAGGAPDAAPTHPAPKPAAHTAPAAERKPVRAAPASSSTSSSTSATKSASSSSSSSSSSSASSASTTPAPRGAAAATGVARRPVGGAAVSASGPGARKGMLMHLVCHTP